MRIQWGSKHIGPDAALVKKNLAMLIHLLMAWIDDDIMKHLLGAEVPQLIGSVRKYFETVREYNALLNPEKLFVFITGVEYVGFIYNH